MGSPPMPFCVPVLAISCQCCAQSPLIPFEMPTRSGAEYQPFQVLNVPLPQFRMSDAGGDAPYHAGGAEGGNVPVPVPDFVGGDINPQVANPVVLLPDLAAAQAGGAHEAGASTSSLIARLPKDPLRLPKFRGDNDLACAEDFIFALEMYIASQPALSNFVDDDSVHPEALASLLATIMGCFPPGSVALVWFRTCYRSGLFTSFRAFSDLFLGQFQQSAASLVTLQTKWEDAYQRRAQIHMSITSFCCSCRRRLLASIRLFDLLSLLC
jgi:hypothetical protein